MSKEEPAAPMEAEPAAPPAAAAAAAADADADAESAEASSPTADKENESAARDGSPRVNKSALRDNIDRKGKNAYYYAHSSTATGPKWDGKPEPKLLGRQPSDLTGSGAGGATAGAASGGFHYHKSNITNYAFVDEGRRVRLYIDLPDVADKCPDDESVSLEHTSSSFCLVVRDYPEEGSERCLSFGKLCGEISGAAFRKKKDRIVLTLTKSVPAEGEGEGTAEPKEWSGVAARGQPSHVVV